MVILLSSCHFVLWVSSVTYSERGWHGAICVVLCCVWCRIPGRLNDRRTPLGELNWIFTAITDTIAWNVLPRGDSFTLHRHDTRYGFTFSFHHISPFYFPQLPVWQNYSSFLQLGSIRVSISYDDIVLNKVLDVKEVQSSRPQLLFTFLLLACSFSLSLLACYHVCSHQMQI